MLRRKDHVLRDHGRSSSLNRALFPDRVAFRVPLDSHDEQTIGFCPHLTT